MAISVHTERSAFSVSTTELGIVSGTSSLAADTTAGVYQLWLDASAMQKLDQYRVRVYEKVLAAGTQRKAFELVLANVQSELLVLPTLVLHRGWEISLQRIAGSDRTFDVAIRRIS